MGGAAVTTTTTEKTTTTQEPSSSSQQSSSTSTTSKATDPTTSSTSTTSKATDPTTSSTSKATDPTTSTTSSTSKATDPTTSSTSTTTQAKITTSTSPNASTIENEITDEPTTTTTNTKPSSSQSSSTSTTGTTSTAGTTTTKGTTTTTSSPAISSTTSRPAISSTTSGPAITDANPTGNTGGGNSVATTAGIAAGVVGSLLIVGLIIFGVVRSRRQNKTADVEAITFEQDDGLLRNLGPIGLLLAKNIEEIDADGNNIGIANTRRKIEGEIADLEKRVTLLGYNLDGSGHTHPAEIDIAKGVSGSLGKLKLLIARQKLFIVNRVEEKLRNDPEANIELIRDFRQEFTRLDEMLFYWKEEVHEASHGRAQKAAREELVTMRQRAAQAAVAHLYEAPTSGDGYSVPMQHNPAHISNYSAAAAETASNYERIVETKFDARRRPPEMLEGFGASKTLYEDASRQQYATADDAEFPGFGDPAEYAAPLDPRSLRSAADLYDSAQQPEEATYDNLGGALGQSAGLYDQPTAAGFRRNQPAGVYDNPRGGATGGSVVYDSSQGVRRDTAQSQTGPHSLYSQPHQDRAGISTLNTLGETLSRHDQGQSFGAGAVIYGEAPTPRRDPSAPAGKAMDRTRSSVMARGGNPTPNQEYLEMDV